MKIVVTSSWTELPIKVGTIQASGGHLEIEAGATAPIVTGEGVSIAPNEKIFLNSVNKVWVRAVGSTKATCLYGGF